MQKFFFLKSLKQKIKNKKNSKNVFWKFCFSIYGSLWKFYMRLNPVKEEIYFWEEHLQIGKRHPWMEEAINPLTRRKQFPNLLFPYIKQMQQQKNEVLQILDVGCGPLTPLAWGVEQKLFNLTAVDPLAKIYIKLLKKNRIRYPVQLIECTGEKLLELFSKASFDIIYCRNALDHTRNVTKCITNIYELLKKDSIFILEGLVKEGTRNNWKGLHQHDLILINCRLMHYNKKGQATDITGNFICIDQVQTGTQPGDWYKIVLRR